MPSFHVLLTRNFILFRMSSAQKNSLPIATSRYQSCCKHIRELENGKNCGVSAFGTFIEFKCCERSQRGIQKSSVGNNEPETAEHNNSNNGLRFHFNSLNLLSTRAIFLCFSSILKILLLSSIIVLFFQLFLQTRFRLVEILFFCQWFHQKADKQRKLAKSFKWGKQTRGEKNSHQQLCGKCF